MIKGGYWSEEDKKRISEQKMGEKNPFFGRKHTPESKKKMSEKTAGVNNPRYGVKLSEEFKNRLRLANLGKKEPESQRNKISLANRKRRHSDETKKKMSEIRKHNDKNTLRLRNMTHNKPSKPQIQLFEIVKNVFSRYNVEMEYIIKVPSTHFFIDVAIPDLKLGFEYDEGYWHQNLQRDVHRHNLIRSQGWRLLHFSSINGGIFV